MVSWYVHKNGSSFLTTKIFYCYVCMLFFVPPENLSWRQMAVNLELCSVLMTFELWNFISFLHLLWHRQFVFKVIFEDTWQSHITSGIGGFTTWFNGLGLSWPRFKHSKFFKRCKHSTKSQLLISMKNNTIEQKV